MQFRERAATTTSHFRWALRLRKDIQFRRRSRIVACSLAELNSKTAASLSDQTLDIYLNCLAASNKPLLPPSLPPFVFTEFSPLSNELLSPGSSVRPVSQSAVLHKKANWCLLGSKTRSFLVYNVRLRPGSNCSHRITHVLLPHKIVHPLSSIHPSVVVKLCWQLKISSSHE